MRSLTKKLFQTFCQPKRKLIEPEPFNCDQLQDYSFVKSNTYQFLIKPSKLQKEHIIYKHQVDTPASVLKKPGLHIFPKEIPQVNRRQKFNAVYKKIEQEYQNSFQKCKLPSQIFHMSRRVKTQIARRLQSIGVIQGRYKHYLVFKSYKDTISQKTKQQYQKKGVKVQCLGGINIFPKGQVWMPTNQKYLIDLISVINQNQSNQNIKTILDMGCGSGVLSFLCAKTFKNAKIFGFDINPAAVDTYNINASSHNIQNVYAFQFDVRKPNEFKQKIKSQKIAQTYDWILINPPWIQAKKSQEQSPLEDGVYDYKGKFLKNSIQLAKLYLKDKNSRILLIYSTLSKQLGIQVQTVQNLCKQNNLLIHKVHERPLTFNLQKPSPLNQFKNKSLIQLFEIGIA